MDSDASWIGSMPEVYDRILGPALFAPFAERLAAAAVAHAATSVLEVAAGTGIGTSQCFLPTHPVLWRACRTAMPTLH